MIEFSKIADGVKKATLGSDRMPAAKLLDVYSINNQLSTADAIILISDNGHKVQTTMAGLASCRLTDDVKSVSKLTTTKEARAAAKVWNVQTALTQENEPLIIGKDLKLKCVHKVDVWDTLKNRPVYNNDAYAGYADFRATCDEINVSNPKSDDKEKQDIRNAKFQAAITVLRATDVVSTEDEHKTQMPIFVVEA